MFCKGRNDIGTRRYVRLREVAQRRVRKRAPSRGCRRMRVHRVDLWNHIPNIARTIFGGMGVSRKASACSWYFVGQVTTRRWAKAVGHTKPYP